MAAFAEPRRGEGPELPPCPATVPRPSRTRGRTGSSHAPPGLCRRPDPRAARGAPCPMVAGRPAAPCRLRRTGPCGGRQRRGPAFRGPARALPAGRAAAPGGRRSHPSWAGAPRARRSRWHAACPERIRGSGHAVAPAGSLGPGVGRRRVRTCIVRPEKGGGRCGPVGAPPLAALATAPLRGRDRRPAVPPGGDRAVGSPGEWGPERGLASRMTRSCQAAAIGMIPRASPFRRSRSRMEARLAMGREAVRAATVSRIVPRAPRMRRAPRHWPLSLPPGAGPASEAMGR